MKTFRHKLLVPFMALAAFCLVVLSACGGPSVEDMIREDLTTQFEEIKSGEDDIIDEIAEGAGSDFETLGVDPAEFVRSYIDGFDYTINDITVEDATATANVTVSCKSMNDILTEFQTQFVARLGEYDASTVPSEEGLYAMAGEIMMEATNNAEVKSTDCSFTYSKDDEGTWSADDDSVESELLKAMMA